jgi:hypothetical protein
MRRQERHDRRLLQLDPAPAGFPVVLFGLAAIAAVDIVVIVRRTARGEPG